MECPSCSKIIPDESIFCLHCGEKIPGSEPLIDESVWDYKDVFLPIEAFAVKEKLILRKSEEPSPAELEKLWDVYSPQIPGLLEREVEQHWAIDPNGLEPECILYEIRSQTFRDYTRADWFWTSALSIFSVGIYLLFIRLVNASNQVVEPKGVNVRLRRKKDQGA
jgi:hypothetical protein